MDCPVADSLVIAAKVKGAICLLELDLVDRKSKLAQVLGVPGQRRKDEAPGSIIAQSVLSAPVESSNITMPPSSWKAMLSTAWRFALPAGADFGVALEP